MRSWQFLPTRFDGLKEAQVAVGEADLDEREVVRRLGVRVEAAQLALAAETELGLAGGGVAVVTAFLRSR